MSPEQCRGAGRVDHRTDIYALGCLMFEMASGRPPFVGEGPGDVLAAHLFQEPPSLARIQPVLADIVARMLAKKPEDRFQTMNEVVSALVGAGRGGRTAQESIPTLRSAIPQEAVRTELHPNATVYKPTTTLGSANGELSTVHGAGRRGPPRLLIVSAVFFFVLSVGTSAIVWVRRNATGQKIADSKATAGDSNVDRPPTAQPEPARSPVVEAAHTPTRSSPSPQRVVLSLDSQPAGADVFRAADGIRVGKTPWKGEYEASSAEAVFLLRLKGYRDQSVVMTLSRDVTRAISMERLARRTSAAKTPTTPPTAEKKQTPASSSAPSDKKPEKNGVVDPFAN
jgi:serine/threonine-protein kinase